MPYEIKAVMTIHSAVLELTGAQLVALANAQPYLQAVCDCHEDEIGERDAAAIALDPVAELLEQIAALLDGGTVTAAPKRRGGGRKRNPPEGQPA